MKEVAVVLAFAVVLGCGGEAEVASPEADADRRLQQAADAADAGRIGESERILEEVLANHVGTEPAIAAEAELSRVREMSEEAVIEALREIGEAQADFMTTQRRYALTIDELTSRMVLADDPTRRDLGYRISLRPSPAADNYTLLATPTTGAEAKRSFFLDPAGVIRWERGGTPTADSPALE